ncbi:MULTISPECIES: nuclear transport factor 2 family protein [Pseudoalteromonas]|uniref:Peptidase n=1 Tax=Pseudoalteromonas porphyrae TaxID=187330 RepID=A0A0N1EU07_9GAMM|nr:nuclear transport factor 2 family protein [Pseudoalteromonas porphyrae]KPH63092.1 peptidase [Pseudoalteromonas porphyrae]
MKTIIKFFILLLAITQFSTLANNSEQQQAVHVVIQKYIDGTSNADPNLITSAFHPKASLILSHPNKPFWQVTAKEFASWFKTKKVTRTGAILSITVDNDIATARAKITTASPVKQYIDQFLLKRFSDGWKIVSKTASQLDITQSEQFLAAMDKRVLFIVSSADFHGDSALATGTSFSELVEAYDVFINAGYQVDVVSSKGGTLPLAYINTSDKTHRQYIYNQDFMYKLAYTLAPEQVDPEKYLAVHYVGGGNAMYQVAENKNIQAISMHVYEQNKGIISAVCHGTAGIVNLKLASGEYLVAGRKITGYPTAFEKTDAAYYQQFPFAIDNLIKQRGGIFNYGQRNQSFIEVDGRIITGTNYQSSREVAQAMIKQLNTM